MNANTFASRNHLPLDRRQRTLRMVRMAMLAALSIVLVLLLRLPIFPAAPFLEYDMADVPVLLAAFAMGPGAGLTVLFVVATIQAFFLGGNGFIGLFMHFVATGAMVLLASFVYRKGRETTVSLILGLLAGVLIRTTLMIPFNFIFIPKLVFDVPIAVTTSIFLAGGVGDYPEMAVTGYQAVKGLLMTAIVPFNLFIAGVNSIIFFILFKSLRYYLAKRG